MNEDPSFKKLATSEKKNEAARLEEIEAGRRRQEQIVGLLEAFGEANGGQLYQDREQFLAELREMERQFGVQLSASELKAVLNVLGERDETAKVCRHRNGNPEPDPELRDTETVPLKEDVDTYFRREVLPYVPDSWVDGSKTKVGYEIPLNRHFYVYEPPRPLEAIEADITALESDILALLKEVTA